MSNVVTLHCTDAYLTSRAARHRRAGRYDEAMALLWKAKNQYGLREDVELEMARVYDEMGCDEEASRSYRRVMRLQGDHTAEALFHLSLTSAQHGDTTRAISYFERLTECRKDGGDLSEEWVALLGTQLQEAPEPPSMKSRKVRARALEHRAAVRLQEGKSAAAQRVMAHALRLRETAQGYTLLACCALIRGRFDEAIHAALKAHRMAPGRVQTLCVLSDAYAAKGELGPSRKALHLAALRAREQDDLFAVAMESAKHGEDELTLHLTGRLLKREPYHTYAMKLRACALANKGMLKEASRLFGRLCGLLPEDSVCAYYYKLTRDRIAPPEQLTLGADVPHVEGVSRASELIAALYVSPEEIESDAVRLQRICRLCDWAFHSPMAGSHTKTVALMLLAASGSDMARNVLLDTLTDTQLHDSVKLNVLQVLTARDGFNPYDMDIGGKLVRLAAGGVSNRPVKSGEANSKIVQCVSDRLSGTDPEAPKAILDLFLRYLDAYPQPKGREEAPCMAALECLYRRKRGMAVSETAIAGQYNATKRSLRMMLRRFARCMQPENR